LKTRTFAIETNPDKMKTINFSDQELDSMLMMYYDELAEAQEYVEQIQEIIKKLSGKPAKEPQKRGRKPRQVSAPAMIAPKAAALPVKKVKKTTTPKPSAKSVPIAASIENTKATKKAEPKKKVVAKAKVVVAKKPVAKPAAIKKPAAKPATVESVVGSLLVKAPGKVVKKAAKKVSTEKQRIREMAASAKLTKPVAKNVAKVKPAADKVAPVEPITAPKA